MLPLLSIACFAVLGAWARYAQSLLVQRWLGRGFPYATLSINLLGSLLMGLLFFATSGRMDPTLRTGLLTGGLGTYTTFSTFSLEVVTLLENRESAKAIGYALVSVLGGVAAAALGALLARGVLP
jgi:CrcB protein